MEIIELKKWDKSANQSDKKRQDGKFWGFKKNVENLRWIKRAIQALKSRPIKLKKAPKTQPRVWPDSTRVKLGRWHH